jgi:hypothetical protein
MMRISGDRWHVGSGPILIASAGGEALEIQFPILVHGTPVSYRAKRRESFEEWKEPVRASCQPKLLEKIKLKTYVSNIADIRARCEALLGYARRGAKYHERR